MLRTLAVLCCVLPLVASPAAAAPPDDEATSSSVVARPAAAPSWWPQVRAGLLAPLHGLGPGPAVAGGLEVRVAERVRLGATAGFEAHAGQAPGRFLAEAQPRGFDAAALTAQQVAPLALALAVEAARHPRGALLLGVEGAVLVVTSRTLALGSETTERGVGAGFSAEAGYAHRLGPLEASLRARWTLRRTAVGPRTEVLELPWYQALGLSLAIAWPL